MLWSLSDACADTLHFTSEWTLLLYLNSGIFDPLKRYRCSFKAVWNLIFFFFRSCFSSYFNELLVCLRWRDYEEDLGIIFCARVEPTESLWTKRGDKQLTTKRLRSTFMSPSSLSFWKPPLNTWVFHLIFQISSYSAANSFFKENQFTSNSL